MGGQGSGGGSRLSDEEHRRRGTFRADRTDEIRNAVAAERVIAGPWLSSIPDPELPLNDIGRNKYNEIAKVLFDQNKLTSVTRMLAEQVAVAIQQQHQALLEGKPVKAALINQMQRALQALKIAEDAPTIATPGTHVNKFASCGFSNRRNATVRLRTPRAAGSGER